MRLQSRRTLTYSAAFTLVPTNECFNRCSYCNFRRDPEAADWLSLEQAQAKLTALQGKGVSEILILSGEVHPQSSRRRAWLDHILQICQLALDSGFLPHSNVGPLSREEMKKLAGVNVSMGLMLEQLTPTLLQTVHRNAPTKDPQLRLKQLEQAGELGIPFTTGLLLGLGESSQDWHNSLDAIASIQKKWGHIQEIILQPYQPGTSEERNAPGFEIKQLPQVIELTRAKLPESIAIQIPPNLIPDLKALEACLVAGASDLGGIVPHDHVNPNYQHLDFESLHSYCQEWGFNLEPRLPVYPKFIGRLSPPLKKAIQPWQSHLFPLGYR